MEIKSNNFYVLLKDIQSPQFVRVLKAGETIRGYWIKTWFKNVSNETFDEWFECRQDIVVENCRIVSKTTHPYAH